MLKPLKVTHSTQYQSVNKKLQNVKNTFVTDIYMYISTLTPKVTKLQSYRGNIQCKLFSFEIIYLAGNSCISCYYCYFIYNILIINKL